MRFSVNIEHCYVFKSSHTYLPHPSRCTFMTSSVLTTIGKSGAINLETDLRIEGHETDTSKMDWTQQKKTEKKINLEHVGYMF